MRTFYVYLLASDSLVLYVGVTNDLVRRVHEHRSGQGADFARRYRVYRLVYYESVENAYAAITREKEIKSWRREKKLRLIERGNPGMVDLLPDLLPTR